MLGIMKRVFALLDREERRGILPLLLMMIVGALIDSLSITLIIPFVSSTMGLQTPSGGLLAGVMRWLVPDIGTPHALVRSILLLILIFWAKNAYLLGEHAVQFRYTAAIRRRIQNFLIHFYLTRPYRFFLEEDSGEIMRTVSTDSDHFFCLLNCILQFFTGGIVTLVMAACVFCIHPRITLLLMVVLAAEYVIVARVLQPLLMKHGKRYRVELGRANGHLIEILSGIKNIKVNGRETFFERRYAARVKGLIAAARMERTFKNSPKLLIEAGTVSAMLIYLYLKSRGGEDLGVMVPILSAFVVAAARILPCMSEASNAVSQAGYFESALTKVEEVCRQAAEDPRELEEAPPMEMGGEITLEGICYSYADRNLTVLDHADMTIRRFEHIGLVGVSGVGKTTLVDVLLGLLEPQEGRIRMDGVPVSTDSAAWRGMFAYIPQKIFLMNGSILENVAFGEEAEADEARVWAALERAQLAEFVRGLPDGLRTQIGEAGARLSAGQIQRVGIARAFYRDPPIFVFDEATSALDADTEQALLAVIRQLRGRKTVLQISHRTNTLEDCDAVYRLSDGRLEKA